MDPLDLVSDTIGVEKIWENDLDSRKKEPVTLGVQAADLEDDPATATVDESLFATIKVGENDVWTGSASISTGLMKVVDGEMTIYEHGHDFTITENVAGGPTYHWDLVADTYRPMVITDVSHNFTTPTTVMLKKVSSDENYTGDYDYKIDGGYYKIETGTATLTAINYRRSNLNLTKQVVDEKNQPVISSELFTFNIKVKDPQDSQVWFSVQTDANDEKTIVKELTTNASAEVKDGVKTGYYYAESGTEISVSLEPGWNLRFTNLPNGTTYTITENQTAGYNLKSATIDNDGTFSLKNDTATGTGTIDKPNTQYTVTFKNEAVTHQVEILKTSQNGTTPLPGAVFSLYSESGYGDHSKTPITINGETQLTSGEDGKISLGTLACGTYYLEEVTPPAGYLRLVEPVKIVVDGNSVTYVQSDNSASLNNTGVIYTNSTDTYTLTVTNNPGTILPVTGGIGTKSLTLAGTVLVLGAALGLGWKRRQEG